MSVNQVDTSETTIDSEWERIIADHGVDFAAAGAEVSDTVSETGSESISETTPENGETLPEGQSVVLFDEKVAMAEQIIKGGLLMAVEMILGVTIPDERYERVAHTWAVVICKRWGDVFAFMAEYADELAAAGATLAFAGAVSGAYRVKKAEEVKVKAEKVKETIHKADMEGSVSE